MKRRGVGGSRDGQGVVGQGGGHAGSRAPMCREVALGDQLLQGGQHRAAGAAEVLGQRPRAGEAGAAGDATVQDRAAERVADPHMQGRRRLVSEVEDEGQAALSAWTGLDGPGTVGFGHEVVQSFA